MLRWGLRIVSRTPVCPPAAFVRVYSAGAGAWAPCAAAQNAQLSVGCWVRRAGQLQAGSIWERAARTPRPCPQGNAVASERGACSMRAGRRTPMPSCSPDMRPMQAQPRVLPKAAEQRPVVEVAASAMLASWSGPWSRERAWRPAARHSPTAPAVESTAGRLGTYPSRSSRDQPTQVLARGSASARRVA